METKKNEVIERYIKRIREEIYNLSPAEDFIESLKQDLYEFQESNPELTEEDIESEFGSPEEIAKDFLEGRNEIQPKEIAKSKRRRNIIIAILVVALLGLGAVLADTLSQRQVMATDVIVIHD